MTFLFEKMREKGDRNTSVSILLVENSSVQFDFKIPLHTENYKIYTIKLG